MNDLWPTSFTTPGNLRAIRILYYAIISGVVMFAIIIVVLNWMTKPESPLKEIENIMLGIALTAGAGCYIAARLIYNKGVAIAKNSLISLADKLNQYRTTLIKYMALCDGPALFGIILFFLTGNFLMLIITGLMIVAMLTRMPMRQRVIEELGLDWQQKEKLD